MKLERNKLKKLEDIYIDRQNPKLHVFKIESNLYCLFDDMMDQPLEYEGYIIVENKIRKIIDTITEKNKSIKSILILRYKLNSNGFVATIIQNKKIKSEG